MPLVFPCIIFFNFDEFEMVLHCCDENDAECVDYILTWGQNTSNPHFDNLRCIQFFTDYDFLEMYRLCVVCGCNTFVSSRFA